MKKRIPPIWLYLCLAIWFLPLLALGILLILMVTTETAGVVERLDNSIVSSPSYYIEWRYRELELQCGSEVHFRLPHDWRIEEIDGQYIILDQNGNNIIICYESPSHSESKTDMAENWESYLSVSLGFEFDEIEENVEVCPNPWVEGDREVSLLRLYSKGNVVYEAIQVKVTGAFVTCAVNMIFLPDCNLSLDEQLDLAEAIAFNMWDKAAER